MEVVSLLSGERQKSESFRAIQACNDYLRMGPGRSLRLLLEQYRKSEQNLAPTRSQGTLWGWSARFGWQERAAAYDARLEADKDARTAEIMQSGLAVAHERVVKLKDLAGFLEGQLYEQGEDGVYHNVWLPDVKQIGSGLDAERVDIERFNAPIIEQYRGTLDDLAKETGGRKERHEVTGADGAPLVDVDAVIAALRKADERLRGGQ